MSLTNQRAGVTGVAIVVLTPHAPVLIPSIGGERLPQVAATVKAMREAARRVVAMHPDSLVVISPHSPRQQGAFGIWAERTVRGSLAQFGAPEVSVDFANDLELAAAIAVEANLRRVATWEISGEPLDHGALVPLWFLAEAGWKGPVVLLGLNHPGEPGLKELSESIRDATERIGRRVAVVASGDMSHRLKPGAPCGFHPRARKFDRRFIELLNRGAYRELLEIDADLQADAAQDAADSTLIAAAAADWNATGHEVLSYEGPFGVGYGVAVLFARD